MSKPSGVSKTLACLEQLRATVRDLARQEDELQARFAGRLAEIERASKSTLARLAERGAADELSRTATLSEREQHHRLVHTRRQTAITNGLLADRRRATQRIDQEESRRKYRVQEGSLIAERRRESETAAADALLGDLRHRCAEVEESAAHVAAEAAGAFRGDRVLRRLLEREWSLAPESAGADEEAALAAGQREVAAARAELEQFRRLPLPRVFAAVPVWVWLLASALGAGAAAVLPRFALPGLDWPRALALFGGLAVVTVGVFWLGRRQARPQAESIVKQLALAGRALQTARERAEQRHRTDHARIQGEYDATARRLRDEWSEALDRAAEMRARIPRELDEQARRVTDRNNAQLRTRLVVLEDRHSQTGAASRASLDREREEAVTARDAARAQLATEEAAAWRSFEADTGGQLDPLLAELRSAGEWTAQAFPEWSGSDWNSWQPPLAFRNAAPFGRLELELEAFAGVALAGRRFAARVPATLSVPLLLTYPDEGSLLFETREEGDADAVAAMNNVIYRLLASTPPGKLSFTVIDPVGLGQSFAGLMRLADFDENNINSRIWTQAVQIEERLAELGEHMEKVIQMYLRDEYATIAEYNAEAGTIAEKYHILVIAGFPVNFSEAAARRLLNIAASGARCGVYTLIQWDQRQPLPHEFVADELRRRSVRIVTEAGRPTLAAAGGPGVRLRLDAPPPPEFTGEFLRRVGESSRGANRVEVGFAQVAPPDDAIWSLDTAEELRVPIGRSGATKLQYLALGRGTRQHGLIAGKTGAGKSTLFHVLITNLASWCGPDQVEFYLVDFKKGVEFKSYATRRLPHARVVAIESDRDFGLSVLERVDDELRRRGDRFRQCGAQDLAGYRRATGEPLPRTLLLIDEFQEFFTEEDRISQSAAVLLDRIVRQGRAFGIHVLLGSQTLGGAYTLARATIGQMVIRVALQCNEADAYLIMDENNPAPRLLSRPGEGIYNDTGGSIEGNSPFQTVWLPEAERDARLTAIRVRADEAAKRPAGPVVFEGNAPADVAENSLLAEVLTGVGLSAAVAPRIWLGAPNSIKGPTEVMFRQQAGNHLLIVGQREEAALTMIGLGLVALAAQRPANTIRLIVLDASAPGSRERAFLDRIANGLPGPVERPTLSEIPEVIRGLAADLKRRAEASENSQAEADAQAAPGAGASAPDERRTFVFIHGLQQFKRLRPEDEFGFGGSSEDSSASAAAQFLELVADGPAHGIHLIATGDTWGSLGRFLGRKALAAFAWRVLFQMSANDSAALVDAPDASRLGLHRALLFNEPEGTLETFRPYAPPGAAWFDTAIAGLAKRGG